MVCRFESDPQKTASSSAATERISMPENEELNIKSTKYAKVPVKFRADVAEFLAANNKPPELDKLTPIEFLKYNLHWNGIIGYTEDIVNLMESLGWERPKPKVTIHTSKF